MIGQRCRWQHGNADRIQRLQGGRSEGRLGEALPGVSTGEDLGAQGATGSRGPGTSTRMSVRGLCSLFLPASCSVTHD